jgi:alkylation response protein AidB-like acyl-CoA dehydrogenase
VTSPAVTSPAVTSPAVTSLDRAAARAFVDARVVPAAGAFDTREQIPLSFLAEVAELGVWGGLVPRQAGGLGLDMAALGAVHEEFGRGCSSLRSLLTVHSMVAWVISRRGTAEQRAQWLGPLAAGEVLAAFCLSEADAGSYTAGIATTARRKGDAWVISGRKKWITGGQIAGLYLVFARTEPGMSAFLIPADAGVEVKPISGLLGTRASMVAELIFDDVCVPLGAMIGPGGFAPGFVLTAALDIGRYSVACGSVGIIQACLEATADYAQARHVGKTPLSEFQLTQVKLADMVTAAAAGRALCERAGRLKDAGDEATVVATWVAKYFASRAAVKAACDAVQVHGANGCTDSYPVARYYRDAKIMEIIEGSSELQQITIADAASREQPR